MLDEIMEVDSYLTNPESDSPRIQKGNLNDSKKSCKLNGIGDILTLVVCQYLYGVRKIEELDEKTSEMAILIMRAWCGFDDDLSEEELTYTKNNNPKWFQQYPDADGWLKRYFYKNFIGSSQGWSEYSKKWSKQFKANMAYTAEAIGYETILAQAVARGPLKQQYLVMKKDYVNVIGHDILTDDNKKPDVRKQRNILKLIAAYKILEQFHPGQEYILLQSERILSWMGLSGSGKADRWCLDMKWKGAALFSRESHTDYKKFRVNPDFMREMNVQLFEKLPDEISDENHIYYDTGHGTKNGLVIL